MLRVGLLTSGGDCQALNATMRGIVKTLYRQSDLLRMLEENYVDMRPKRKRGKSPT